MGRTIINQIECRFCRKSFDVATEDIEWGKIIDLGECESNSDMHDFAVYQSVECLDCKKQNKVLVKAKGKSIAYLETVEVVSVEVDEI